MIYFGSFLIHIHGMIAWMGILSIALGALYSLFYIIKSLMHSSTLDLNLIRLQFGKCITLGLEFMVGADILNSLVSPNYYNLGILGLLVLIRSFLSYFLNRELEEIAEPKGTKK